MMLNSIDFSGRPFHFLGIGGIGMSAIAHILVHRKLPVSGSDLKLSHITERLGAMGAHVFSSQNAKNLSYFQGHQLPQVVCSTAISTNNPEYSAALEMGCPILHRSDVLAGLIAEYKGISVGGTHGKTTTSGLIGYVLVQAGLDPTVIVGGEVAAWQGNARAGNGPYLVAEADESDGSLVKFNSYIGVITNIEHDHPDHYQDLAQVVEVFQAFASHSEIVIGCIDCPVVREQIKPDLSYSLDRNSGATYSVDEISYTSDGTHARLWEKEECLGWIHVSLLGSHNLSNALAAVAVARHLGATIESIQEALSSFSGAKRRFEVRGEANGIRFIDDYAHHPSELQVTLAAARLQAGDRKHPNHRIVAFFQPHRYSRTLTFLPEFARSFTEADVVVITDIYSAGEENLSNITGQHLVDLISKSQSNVYYRPTLDAVKAFLPELLQPGDMALFLGAGNLNQVIPDAIASFKEEETETAEKVTALA
jgi:UDP-N-acetylmuramate--alanine ligase